jgi:membrane dipeptidase
MILVDGHEDLAWNAITFGRDYTKSVAETRAQENNTEVPKHNGQTLLGWPEWVKGRIAVIFATLFAAPERRKEGPWDTLCYRDFDQAYQLYRSNLAYYQRLDEEHGDKFQLISGCRDLEGILNQWNGVDSKDPQIGLVLLMEGAEGVREPSAVQEWFDAGVRILGPAWTGTRYAGGTGEPGPLTPAGRTLLDAMTEVGMILDLSHMSEEGSLEALDRYEGSLIASHSNPLALMPHSRRPERYLSDRVIVGIAERGGVIGIVLPNYFLVDGWKPEDGRDAVTLDNVVAHIDHICQLLGSAKYVGIGSDFDGGFGLDKVPSGLDSVADLGLIGDVLSERGYQLEEVEGVLGGNWLNMLRQALPES